MLAAAAERARRRPAAVCGSGPRGGANREIAERLYLSPHTVEKHVERLLAKLGVTRSAELWPGSRASSEGQRRCTPCRCAATATAASRAALASSLVSVRSGARKRSV